MKYAIIVAALIAATPALAGQSLQLDRFYGVTASDGARVTIRHGATQQVTLISGDAQTSRIEVRDKMLHIETCIHHCPWGYKLEVEIVTPGITQIAASDGGSIDVESGFPAQDKLYLTAEDGGRVDARALPASKVDAKAEDGGDLLLRADNILNANADDGGNIRYWGKATVNRMVSDGGSVSGGE
jgi:hypothetical protein